MKKIIKILFILSLVSFTSGQTAEELKAIREKNKQAVLEINKKLLKK